MHQVNPTPAQLSPSLHSLLQGEHRLICVGHEVLQLELLPALTVSIGVKRGDQRRATLDAHAQVQGAALGPVLLPAQELRVAQPLLCFCDGATTDSAQHQLVPELV